MGSSFSHQKQFQCMSYMSSKQSFKGKHLAAIGCNSYITSPAQMSPARDSTLEVTWHQYCAIGEGEIGVELERILFGYFCLSE